MTNRFSAEYNGERLAISPPLQTLSSFLTKAGRPLIICRPRGNPLYVRQGEMHAIMSNDRKSHFDAQTVASGTTGKPTIWDLPDDVLDQVSGGLSMFPTRNFTQRDPGGGIDFAQNYSCFAQNIGDFSEGTPPDP